MPAHPSTRAERDSRANRRGAGAVFVADLWTRIDPGPVGPLDLLLL
jgi:hypothetical protein